MNTMSIALFDHHSDAESFRDRLRAENFPAEIHERVGVTRLEVPHDQFERAYQRMIDWDVAENGVRGAFRCPECNSLRIEFPQYNVEKSVLPNLAMGLLANIGAMKKQFYCRDCHSMWPKGGTTQVVEHKE